MYVPLLHISMFLWLLHVLTVSPDLPLWHPRIPKAARLGVSHPVLHKLQLRIYWGACHLNARLKLLVL